jgi:hypothetical protein
LLVPEINRQQAEGQRVAFRADAAFARPEMYNALAARGVGYAISIPANSNLELAIEDLLFRSPRPPTRKPLVRYNSFQYQADSWNHTRRIVAKVEHHVGELFPLGLADADGLTPDPPDGGNLARQRKTSGQVSRRCAEVAGRPLCSRLEVFPRADFEGGKECNEITSLYVLSRGVESGSSQSAKMEIPVWRCHDRQMCGDRPRQHPNVTYFTSRSDRGILRSDRRSANSVVKA